MSMTLSRKTTLTIGAVLSLLLVVGFLSVMVTRQLAEAFRQVAHSYQVIGHLHDFRALLTEAESSQRGYLLSAHDDYLEQIRQTREQLPQRLADLHRLVSPELEQHERIDKLEAFANQRLNLLDKILETRRREGMTSAQRLLDEGCGKDVMDKATDVLNRALGFEESQLKTRTDEAQLMVYRDHLVVAGLCLFALALAGMALHLAHRDVQNREEARRQLQRAYDDLDRRVQQRTDELTRINHEKEQLVRSAEHERQEAITANCLKDEFLATLSHELRTPIQAMLGWVTLLRTGKLDAPTSARAVEVIERNTKTQAKMIEDLLDASRIISGKLRLEVHPVALLPVLEAALDAVRPAAAAKAIELHTNYSNEVAAVDGDSDRLQQVIWNLLANAVKFTPTGGHIYLSLAVRDDQAEISVRDTGKGIEPELLPYVFDRFRQSDSSSTRAHGGLGLGLAIVRHLVELHGGTVEAASFGPDRGATFRVLLPLPRPSVTDFNMPLPLAAVFPHAEAESPGAEPVLQNVPILVVDDERDTRELLGTVLQRQGANVMVAASVAEALAMLELHQPAVLISDIGMPVQDGYGLIRQIRALPAERGGRLPAIALTAYARVEDCQKALAAGFHHHVPKPVEPRNLIRVVACVLSEAALRPENKA